MEQHIFCCQFIDDSMLWYISQLFYFFLAICNWYFLCLEICISEVKGFEYLYLEITGFSMYCLELQELMVNDVHAH